MTHSVRQSVSSLTEGHTLQRRCQEWYACRTVALPRSPSSKCQMPSTARRLEKVFFLKTLSGFAGDSAYAMLDQELESVLPRSPPDPHPNYSAVQHLAKNCLCPWNRGSELQTQFNFNKLYKSTHRTTSGKSQIRVRTESLYSRDDNALMKPACFPRSRGPGLRRMYNRVITQ